MHLQETVKPDMGLALAVMVGDWLRKAMNGERA
jgi:hypothetical protein